MDLIYNAGLYLCIQIVRNLWANWSSSWLYQSVTQLLFK